MVVENEVVRVVAMRVVVVGDVVIRVKNAVDVLDVDTVPVEVVEVTVVTLLLEIIVDAVVVVVTVLLTVDVRVEEVVVTKGTRFAGAAWAWINVPGEAEACGAPLLVTSA